MILGEVMKIDTIKYEEFLNISVSSMPPGSLTTGDVVLPEEVHPTRKEKGDGKD